MESDSTPQAPRRTALVLKGGGVKGLAFAGALQVLEPHYSFDAFVGTSAGAITAVLLAAGYDARELEKALREKDFGEFVSEPWPGCLWRLFTQKGWYSGDPIQTWVQSLLNRKIPRETGVTMGDLPGRAIIYAAKRPGGTLRFDSRGQNKDVSADFAARCSMSIPFLFMPPTVEGSRVFDGGVLHNFPFDDYLSKNPKSQILGLYLSTGPRSRADRPGIFGELLDLVLDRDERATVDEHRDHIVVIDPSPIRTAQFSLTETAKEFLLAQGRASALRFLVDHRAEVVSSEQAQTAEEQATALRERVVAEDRARRRRRHTRTVAWILAVVLFALGAFLLDRAIDRWKARTAKTILAEVQVGPLTRPPPPPPTTTTKQVPKLSDQELRSLVGSLFLVSFEDWRVAEQLAEKDGVSGFFFLKRNVEEKETDAQRQEALAAHIDRIQEIARKRPWPTAMPGSRPLIIAVDQEGGSTQVLPSAIVTEIPAPMALGGLREIDPVDRAARIVSSELKAIGVNVNLAPVADVNKETDNSLIRDRSFGGDGGLVRQLALAWYEASKCEGILSVAKHFPGHGSTAEGIEGHKVPVSEINTRSLPEIIAPFRALVGSGVPAVMTSHFKPINISQGEVVTFDPRMIELLRGSEKRFGASGLAFGGAILSDDLNMPCVTAPESEDHDRKKYQDKLLESIKRAFLAGHDLLLVGNIFPASTSPKSMTSESLPKGITLPEFRRLVEEFSDFIFKVPLGDREIRLRRLNDALARVYALRSLLAWPEPASSRLPYLRKLRDNHRQEAERLFRTSFGVLPASGDVCPDFHPQSKIPALVIFPTEKWSYRGLQSLDTEARKRTLKKEREDNDVARYLRKYLPHSREEMMAGPGLSDKEALDHAVEIAAIVRETRPPLTVFVLTFKNQVDLFGKFLVETSKIPGFNRATIAVIVTSHPNQLSRLNSNKEARSLAGQVTYFFAYTGSRQQAARLLVEELFKLEPGHCPEDWPLPPVPISPILEDVNYQVVPRSGKLSCRQAGR
ncbi:MAG: glycoside hydrolase family 3 N-terminal domain-containing protein [Thermoanaerobaculia bacterium]